jgi:hypothetical protein
MTLMAWLVSTALADPLVVDRIVAVVHDEAITLSEVHERCLGQEDLCGAELEGLIRRLLVRWELGRLGLDVSAVDEENLASLRAHVLAPRVTVTDDEVRDRYQELAREVAQPQLLVPLADAREELRHHIFQEKLLEAEEEWYQRARREAAVEVRAQP